MRVDMQAFLLDTIGALKDIVVRFVLDNNPVKWGKAFWGVSSRWRRFAKCSGRRGDHSFILGVGATSNNVARRHLFDFALSHRLRPLSVIHASSICSKRASPSDGVQSWQVSLSTATRRSVQM